MTNTPTTSEQHLSSASPATKSQLLKRLSLDRRTPRVADSGRGPAIQPDARGRFEPFPLAEIQQAYLLGSGAGVELGNISCTNYFEHELRNVEPRRLDRALAQLIARHDMLRAIVLPNGQQQVLAGVPPYEIPVEDLSALTAAESERLLLERREAMSRQVLRPADRWPLFDFRLLRLTETNWRLLMCFDLLIADSRSLRIIQAEWAQLYADEHAELAPLRLGFRDYVLAVEASENTAGRRAARQFWQARLPDLPPAPELPLAKDLASVARPRFERRTLTLPPHQWRALAARAAQESLTPSTALLAAYAEVLAIWSKSQKFTLNLTLFNRLPLHEQVDQLVGEFTSTALLEIDNIGRDVFRTRSRHLQERLWKDLDHRAYSGLQVMAELARSRRASGKALMPVVFTSLLNLDYGLKDRGRLSSLGRRVFSISQTPQVYLDCIVSDNADGALEVAWDCVEEVFPPNLLDDLFAAFGRLLEDLASDPSAWDRSLPENARRLIPAEQMQLRRRLNAPVSAPPTVRLHELFLSQLARNPEHVAVWTPSRQVTYGDLYRHACAVEQELLKRGIAPNQAVAVLMNKGWEQVAAVLGILFAGAAYLPLDADWPPERVQSLVENGEVKLILTQSTLLAHWPITPAFEALAVDTLPPMSDVPALPRCRQSPEDLAYIIYTSGSTGKPKGVMIDHRGAVNTILDINQRFAVGAADRVLALSRLTFDLSVYDIFGMLAAGGTIVFPSVDLAYDIDHWLELIRSQHVTVWNTVPALMQLLADHPQADSNSVRSLRLIMMSGDWIPVALPAQLRALNPQAKIISLGGATEASIWSILYPIETIDPNWTSIPYGTPMRNQSFHILNQVGAPCPIWVPGQLYIGGTGLAKGYWRDDLKTQASFAFMPAAGERLYRTGDFGRYLPDGNIEFLGREDAQVKIHGYRIELGEVEACLQQHSSISHSLVLVRSSSTHGPSLVAYVVFKRDRWESVNSLTEHLRSKLPSYMVPSAIVVLNELPLTANGKVDRQALPDTPAREVPCDNAGAARDPLEMQLKNLWERVLGVRHIGIHDNFFDLGGTSLIAVKLLSAVHKATGHSAPLSILLGAPTVEKMATCLRSGGWQPRWKSLVPLQPAGRKPVFYCVHGAGGNVLMFRALAAAMGEDYPFYALQAASPAGQPAKAASVEELAEAYLGEIREFQPEGPYFLGGFCFGGLIALEIARRLQIDGKKVALLALIDTYNFNGVGPVLGLPEATGTLARKLKFHVANLWQLGVLDGIRYLAFKASGVLHREFDRLLVLSTDIVQRSRGLDRSLASLERRNEEAGYRYVPQPYSGPATIIKPKRNYSHLSDPNHGWKGVIMGGLQVMSVPVQAGGLFSPPYSGLLAQRLTQLIDAGVEAVPAGAAPALRLG